MIATAQNKHLDVDNAMLSTCDTCLSNKQHTEHVITLYNVVYTVGNPLDQLVLCCQGIYMGVLLIKKYIIREVTLFNSYSIRNTLTCFWVKTWILL